MKSIVLAGASVLALAGAAFAADPIIDEPIFVDDPVISAFEGLYVGAYIGYQPGSEDIVGGGIVGGNLLVTESLLIGAELQAGWDYWPDGEQGSVQVIGLARAGFVISDSALIYGAAGFEYSWEEFGLAAGGGIEFNVTENIGLRGEVLAIVDEGDLWSARATAAVLFRF